ncbi:hypothetical protein CCUS01_05505 [Colletotrichum cuscutae]|uniref:Secreted protein n=1 Tax=Colletotrichum cuscutae TaxID=1209917 RepID=A0AAI9VAE5_9PEZI|nr:hypothetical protein CCUS01_05505 [Colletotrichum cuscutae]
MCAGAGAGACVCSCSALCSVLLLRFLPRCLGRQEEGKVRKVRYEAEVLIKHTGVPALAAAAQRKSQYTHSLHTLYLSLHRPSLPSLPSRVHSLPAPLRSFPRLFFFFFFFLFPLGSFHTHLHSPTARRAGQGRCCIRSSTFVQKRYVTLGQTVKCLFHRTGGGGLPHTLSSSLSLFHTLGRN